MNLKQSAVVIPLSLVLVIPSVGAASAHGNEMHMSSGTYAVTVKSPAADLP